MAESSSPPVRAVIFGCAGPRLGADERRFFQRTNPLGFILFARNCETPDQVAALVAELRAAVGRADAPVLIDQEGGRVQRLGPPHWPALPAARALAGLADADPEDAAGAAWLLGRLLAAQLAPLGITVDCAPVLDVGRPETHEVIGDRAIGSTPARVARLGRAVCDGLLAGGVLPVIKHIPGHGRAVADSHLELPVGEAPLADLERVDFRPCRELADMPWAMTAHVVFTAVDAAEPVSTSAPAIRKVVRGAIGFGGLLLSDDIGMQALSGDMGERARACLAAGCDVALHCSGDMAEMELAAAGARPLRPVAATWLARAERRRRAATDPFHFDAEAGLAKLQRLLAGAA